MKKAVLLLLISLFSGTSSFTARASTVYSQPANLANINDNQFGVYSLYDDFTLNATYVVNDINLYFLVHTGSGPGKLPDSDAFGNFLVDFFLDDASFAGVPDTAPGTLISSNSYTNVGFTFVSDTSLDGYELYDYDVAVNPFIAQANETYWIGLNGGLNGANAGWQTGSNGDGLSYLTYGRFAPIATAADGPLDYSFSIGGTAVPPSVPEPSSLLLAGSGFLCLISRLRCKRK